MHNIMALAACADKSSSGVMNQPCAKVAKYCNEKMFAAKLAVNCAKTCGKCKAAKAPTTKAPTTKAKTKAPSGTLFKSSNPACSLARRGCAGCVLRVLDHRSTAHANLVLRPLGLVAIVTPA